MLDLELAYSPDGKWLVARRGGQAGSGGDRDIVAMQVGTDTVFRPLIANPKFDETAFAISPDGKWIAFESNETGRMEVYIRPFPNVDGGKWQLSSAGGRAPLWARNGREIFFVNEAREMVVAPLSPARGTPGLGDQRTLFRFHDDWFLSQSENYTPYDISPDGQHFLMARQVQAASGTRPAPILLVDNWFQELRQRLQKK